MLRVLAFRSKIFGAERAREWHDSYGGKREKRKAQAGYIYIYIFINLFLFVALGLCTLSGYIWLSELT